MPEDDYNLSDLLAPSKTLSEATAQELFDALKQKTQAIICAWIEPHADNSDYYNAQYGGSWATAYGLLHYFGEWVEGRIPGQCVDEDDD